MRTIDPKRCAPSPVGGSNERDGECPSRSGACATRGTEPSLDALACAGRVAPDVAEACRQARKMEALGQLTGGVAHDFNNLLQIILGSLQMVRHRQVEPADVPGLLDDAMTAAQRAATLTRQLLVFSRRQPLHPEPLEVAPLLESVATLLERTLGENIALVRGCQPDIWPICVDAGQLESGLLNLAVNARDAMPRGGTVRLRARNVRLAPGSMLAGAPAAPGRYVLLSVADAGTGMPADTARRATEPFFTTKEPGRGTGLGLAQVHDFVRQSGGYLTIDSCVGLGTTISLYLPRRESPSARPGSSLTPCAVRASGRERVVLVEDNLDVRARTGAQLRSLGYEVLEAPAAAEALRLLETRRPIQLLLTDVGLPGDVDGAALAREAHRRWPTLHVLLATGYGHDRLQQAADDASIPVLHKPFTVEQLAHSVRRAIDGSDLHAH